MIYRNSVGDRIFLTVDYGGVIALNIRDGYNPECKIVTNYISIEEMHDLRHMLGRAISALELHEKSKL